MSATESPRKFPTNSLAFEFQDVITVILRVRFRTQRVADVAAFRNNVRQMISTATTNARAQGYSDPASKMALYAIVGFLDESVLNSGDPTFSTWSQRTVQEEMFGSQFAGEYFFRHIEELLHGPDSNETADVLELHAICILLGYRGRYAFNDRGEIQNILRAIREKIARIRGPEVLCRVPPAPEVPTVSQKDPWIRRLFVITAATAVLALVALACYKLILDTTLAHVTMLHITLPFQQRTVAALASGLKGRA
ncbi:type VI secretion system protein ImpK [Bryocella elongata]|uniref:Type VI secretion system protein ImpK n=1 Tax=Bryocella elongata TaxID=863522 RepID=A0A1H6ACZ0_9BACT|nr:DotU family type IV/VI secretion system protein [Bryocella elongata]SEG46160.1 type VI secretion system protein ImpK [Bryocella elongata]